MRLKRCLPRGILSPGGISPNSPAACPPARLPVNLRQSLPVSPAVSPAVSRPRNHLVSLPANPQASLRLSPAVNHPVSPPRNPVVNPPVSLRLNHRVNRPPSHPVNPAVSPLRSRPANLRLSLLPTVILPAPSRQAVCRRPARKNPAHLPLATILAMKSARTATAITLRACPLVERRIPAHAKVPSELAAMAARLLEVEL